jgi:hypothetical protein
MDGESVDILHIAKVLGGAEIGWRKLFRRMAIKKTRATWPYLGHLRLRIGDHPRSVFIPLVRLDSCCVLRHGIDGGRRTGWSQWIAKPENDGW